MKRTLEKLSILSLSLLLVSTYSVSAALPSMMDHFANRSRTEVEQLISITSFAIMIVILLNNWIARYLSERMSIVIGIILIAVCGSAPMAVQDYTVVLVTRILLGVGIGLVNTYAVNMISERYEENERATLLGFRSSAETLGNAVLTLIAGQLLAYGWQKAFAIYLFALPVLVLYLCFVPDSGSAAGRKGRGTDEIAVSGGREKSASGEKTVRDHLGVLLGYGCLGMLLICINSSTTLRIPALTLERGMGTEADSSVVLSIMLAMGIIAGFCFGKLSQILGGLLTAVSILSLCVSMVIIACSGHIFVLGIGAMVAGLSYGILITSVFNEVSGRLPKPLLSLGTTCVLAGCNLGATISPYVLKLIGCFSNKIGASFVAYAILLLVLGVGFLLHRPTGAGKSV